MATKQKQYTLYLDESKTHNGKSNPHFCMAGAIINDKEYAVVESAVKNLKKFIWDDLPNPESIILHQKNIINASKGNLDVIKFPEYERFRSKGFRKKFYKQFAQIFDCGKIQIVGGSVDMDYMQKKYDVRKPTPSGAPVAYRNQTNEYLITLQLLIENYCHFLVVNNAKGRIVYEAISEIENERLSSKFYQIKLMGSMYMTKSAMEEHLLGIQFIRKQKNNSGLQVADFIPYAFAREHAGFGQMDGDTTLINKMKYYRYGGTPKEQERYGVKKMP